MSSDLWSAFAGRSDDLSDNPWSQPSSDVPQTLSQRDSECKPGHVAYNPNFTVFNKPKDGLGWAGPGTGYDNGLKAPDATNEVWATHRTDPQSAWADLHAAIPEVSPWSSHGTAKYASAPPISDLSLEPLRVIQEDEFGDFEEPVVQSPRTEILPIPVTSSVKQLKQTGKHCETYYSSSPHHLGAKSRQDYDPWSGLGSLEQPNKYLSEIKEQSSGEVFNKNTSADRPVPSQIEKAIEVSYDAEEWGEFSPDPQPGPASKNLVTSNKPVQIVAAATDHSRILPEPPTKDDLSVKAAGTSPSRPSSIVPPTNIPPPSSLISLVAGLVQKLPIQVEKIIKQLPASKTTPKALDRALRGCLASLRVAGRIIAGRKHRWKRDLHLSQSMKIGPAQAGKTGGMKLTGVDKAEKLREDRETAEFVRIWKQNLGSIRAVLATVNGQIEGSPLTLPDISERMTLRAAKAEEGGITASKCCFLCGLKREERVSNIDSDVWDTLGEWWSEHWGHVECKTFWQGHEKFLQKRG